MCGTKAKERLNNLSSGHRTARQLDLLLQLESGPGQGRPGQGQFLLCLHSRPLHSLHVGLTALKKDLSLIIVKEELPSIFHMQFGLGLLAS
jgi:hypothetical protein